MRNGLKRDHLAIGHGTVVQFAFSAFKTLANSKNNAIQCIFLFIHFIEGDTKDLINLVI